MTSCIDNVGCLTVLYMALIVAREVGDLDWRALQIYTFIDQELDHLWELAPYSCLKKVTTVKLDVQLVSKILHHGR